MPTLNMQRSASTAHVSRNNIQVLVDAAAEAIANDDLDRFLRLYADLRITPPLERLQEFAERALSAGHLDDGLYAYALLGIEPEPFYLDRCAQTSADERTAARATYLAQRFRH